MFAVEVLTFTHLRKKNLEKFEYRNTEFYFDSRFLIFAPLAFMCSNLYYSERAHCEYNVSSEGSLSTKEKLGKFEHRNTEFYFDFRFSIFAHLAFLCSDLYYSERAHCEYHDPSEGSHFHPSTKEKQQNLNIEIQDFILIFFSIFSHLAFLCSVLYNSMRAHCEYHFRSEDAQFEYRSRSDMPFSKSGEL